MRVLLIYPKFPRSLWSFEKILRASGKKVLFPPLGLITVAAILPQEWQIKLIDRNVSPISEADWEWAELVMLSAMSVQRHDFFDQIKEAKQRGKKVAVGGPYSTSLPQKAEQAGADYLILDEAELTIPKFLEAFETGAEKGIFRSSEKPDVTLSPIPRFDLLELDAYLNMSIQFSRGCPFLCEFCDIITLYGRKPRTKTPEQIVRELDTLYELGWRGGVFIVDDNFIGNKPKVKPLLHVLKKWVKEKDYFIHFFTEASLDLSQDDELIDLMVEANFRAVFLGIETPDEESLVITKKTQNIENPMREGVEKIIHAGIVPMGGFIIGFDGEKVGAGDRIVRFAEETAVPILFFQMLQVLPNTALHHRLAKEGRYMEDKIEGDMNQTTLINFIPTRPVEEIANEYMEGFWHLYDPEVYLNRTFRTHLKMKPEANPVHFIWKDVRFILHALWRQGVIRSTRWIFWQHMYQLLRKNPQRMLSYAHVSHYIEHFEEFRYIVREQVSRQLAQEQKIA